jgi:Outer membrane lipoprotein carrier protein LolA-like
VRFLSLIVSALLLSPVHGEEGQAGELGEEVGSADVVMSLRARMGEPTVLRGEFEQTRVLHLLRRPLVSQGHFLLVQDRGLFWQQASPFRSSLLLQSDRMVQRVGDGEPVIMRASEQPVPFAISQVFLNLLGGDGAGLERHFDLALIEDADDWSLTLTPKPGPLASAIERVEVGGSRFVERIEVHTTNGDRTSIRMFEVGDQPEQLSAAESDAFDG